MSIINSLTAHFNNSKRNPFTSDKKNKTSNLKIDIIINNTAKIRENDDFNSLNNKNNPKREKKPEKNFIIKKIIIKIKKYKSPNQINITERKRNLNSNFFSY